MRQFKFRLWHTDEYPVVELRNTMAYQPDISLDGAFDAHTYGNGVLMQFVGQVDMTGKDVYEGDIIETRHEDKMEKKGFALVYNVIAFQDGCFGITGENSREVDCFRTSGDLNTDATVVGNIYQNPELVGYVNDVEELKRWDDKRFAHIPDIEPLVQGKLSNYLEWEEACKLIMNADGFDEHHINLHDWAFARTEYFNTGMTAKEAHQDCYYE